MGVLEHYTVGPVYYHPISAYMRGGGGGQEQRFSSLDAAMAHVDVIVARQSHGQIPVHRHKRFGRGSEQVAYVDIDQRRLELGIPLDPELSEQLAAALSDKRPALSDIESTSPTPSDDRRPQHDGVEI